MSEAVVIGRVIVRTPDLSGSAKPGRSRTGADPLLRRLRAAHLLETADLTPPGLPPGAILTIRRLADPLPGRLTLNAPQLAPDRAWQAALTGRLAALASHAGRPLREAIGAGAEAVLFADQGELLACLALDWLAGQLLNRWWWREVVRNRELAAAVAAAWLSALDALPAALVHLNGKGEAAAFLRKLDDGDVARLLTGLVERHRLTALDEVVQASVRGPGLRDAALAGGQRETAPLDGGTRPDREDVSWPETGATEASAGRAAQAAPEVPPWQGLVSPDSRDLTQTRQILLGVGLGLVQAPQAVRGEAYARQVRRWYEGRPAETVEPPTSRPATPPSPVEEAAPGRTSRRDERPSDEQADGVGRREPESMAQTGDTAASAALAEGGPSDAANERTEPAEGHGVHGAAPAAEAAEETNEPPSAGAAEAPAVGAKIAGAAALEVVEVRTAYAGLFYLVNGALGMGFYADFTQPDAEGELALSPWAFLALIGRALAGDGLTGDPVWGLLDRLAGVDGDFAAGFVPPDGLSVGEWVERTAGEVFDWTAARFAAEPFPEPLAGPGDLVDIALARAGRIRVSAGRLDVTLRLDELHIAVRLAGLDRNPGWVPAAGRTITFYYE